MTQLKRERRSLEAQKQAFEDSLAAIKHKIEVLDKIVEEVIAICNIIIKFVPVNIQQFSNGFNPVAVSETKAFCNMPFKHV